MQSTDSIESYAYGMGKVLVSKKSDQMKQDNKTI